MSDDPHRKEREAMAKTPLFRKAQRLFGQLIFYCAMKREPAWKMAEIGPNEKPHYIAASLCRLLFEHLGWSFVLVTEDHKGRVTMMSFAPGDSDATIAKTKTLLSIAKNTADHSTAKPDHN